MVRLHDRVCPRRFGLLAFVITVLAAGGCHGPAPEAPVPAPPAAPAHDQAGVTGATAGALSAFNRGAAQLEQYQYAAAAKTLEGVVASSPGWIAARFNLGLALLNLPETPDALDRAEAQFQSVLASEPESPWAHFCLGALYQHRGEYDRAADHLARVHAVDPHDPFVSFEYAESLRKLNRDPEALRILEQVVQRDPGFVSALYSLGMLYNRMHQREKAVAVLKRFGELKPQELAVGSYGVVEPYAGRGKYYTALGADGLPVPASAGTEAPRVLFSPEIRTLDARLAAWTWHGGKVSVPGIAVGDVDGDGDQDLVMAGTGSTGQARVLLNDGKAHFQGGPILAEQTVAPCLGDIDNDGDLDLWLGREGQDLLLLGDGKGTFTRVPAQPAAAAEFLTTCARLLDLDSDGDLDLLAMRIKGGSLPAGNEQVPAASRVFNNNLDGTFADLAASHGLALTGQAISAVVQDDFDNDRDIDMILLSPAGRPLGWENFRMGQYRVRDAQETQLEIDHPVAATTGNLFGTGNRDLLVFAGKELALFRNRGLWRFERDESFSASHGSLGGTSGQFVDIDNDGDLDLVIADAHRSDGTRGPALLLNDWPNRRFLDAARVDPGNLLTQWKCAGPALVVAADFDGDGRPDLLFAAMGQALWSCSTPRGGGTGWHSIWSASAGRTRPAVRRPRPWAQGSSSVRDTSRNSSSWARHRVPPRCRPSAFWPGSGRIARWTGCGSSGPIRSSRPSSRWRATRC